MIALLQRVQHAYVAVNEQVIGKISTGILVFLGVEKQDTETRAQRLIERILNYRIFSDREGKMNLSILDIAGGLLLVPQFTLAADTKKGMRPSFSSAAEPELGRRLFDYTVAEVRRRYPVVQTGEFGASMKVTLCNDGPATFILTVN